MAELKWKRAATYSPTTFKDASFEISIDMKHPDKGAAVSLQKMADAINPEMDKKIKTYEDAMKDLDAKVANYKKVWEKQFKEKKQKEADATFKEMKDLIDKTKKVLETYRPGVEKDLAASLAKHLEEEKKANEALRKAQTKIIVIASLKIGAALLGAAAGVGTAVVSAGGASPVAIAAVGGAIKVISTAAASLKGLFEGEVDTRAKIKSTWVYVKADMEKAKLKDLKPDKGTMDKIKAFFKTNNAKKCAELLDDHTLKITKLEQGVVKLGDSISSMLKKAEELEKSVSDPKKKESATKLTAKTDYYLKKIDYLNKNVDYAKAWNLKKKKQLEAVRSSGDIKGLGGDLMEGIKEIKENSEELIEMGSAFKDLLEAVIK